LPFFGKTNVVYPIESRAPIQRLAAHDGPADGDRS
jgi:hypothetical protein